MIRNDMVRRTCTVDVLCEWFPAQLPLYAFCRDHEVQVVVDARWQWHQREADGKVLSKGWMLLDWAVVELRVDALPYLPGDKLDGMLQNVINATFSRDCREAIERDPPKHELRGL